MASSVSAMLNVRMDRAVKDAGDAALSELGVSTSAVTRALWEKLALGGSVARRQVERIMQPIQKTGEAESIAQKRVAFARVDASWETLVALLGPEKEDLQDLPADKDALAEQRLAYLQEKWGELA